MKSKKNGNKNGEDRKTKKMFMYFAVLCYNTNKILYIIRTIFSMRTTVNLNFFFRSPSFANPSRPYVSSSAQRVCNINTPSRCCTVLYSIKSLLYIITCQSLGTTRHRVKQFYNIIIYRWESNNLYANNRRYITRMHKT